MKKKRFIIAVIIIVVLLILSNIKIYSVVSGSMEPCIKTGDVVIVIKKQHYQVNEIISFKKQNTVVTHRIVSVNDNGYVTKGDANNANDVGIVKNDDVIGKVILTVSILGYVLFYLKRYFIYIVFFLVMIELFKNLKKQRKIDNEKI